jgi:hypothetical protein
MQSACAIESARGRSSFTGPFQSWDLDPLGSFTGDNLVIDRVSLLRIVCVAAETGSRMEREKLGIDPLAWMTSPLALFRGRPPIEACMSKEECCKAILIHSLGLQLDIDCEELDTLIDVESLGLDLEVIHD